MYRVKINLGILYYAFMFLTISTTNVNIFRGVSAENHTEIAEAEQQAWFNASDVNATELEVAVSEATDADATEVEATEAEATEVEATKAEATEVEATEANPQTPEVASTPHPRNITRTQALKDWGGHLLATKYMGSLAVLYLALCLFLALKSSSGIFVR